MSKSSVVVAPQVVAYINGKRVGRVFSFRWSSDTPRKSINGLDQLTPQELAPTSARCSGSVGILRTVMDGGIEGLGMTAHSSQVVREKYFSLTLVDRLTDTILFRADKCSVINQSWDVAEKGVVRGMVNWEALEWSNECLPAT